MHIQPYLFFNGRCEEAVEFYRRVLGAQVEMLMHFGESPEPPQPGRLPPGMEKKVMHAAIRIGESMVLMTDGPTAEHRLSRFLVVAVVVRTRRPSSGSSPGLPTAARYGCRSRRPSSRRDSAW